MTDCVSGINLFVGLGKKPQVFFTVTAMVFKKIRSIPRRCSTAIPDYLVFRSKVERKFETGDRKNFGGPKFK